MKYYHEVIVGNITVYSGRDTAEAEAKFDAYMVLSQQGYGRAANEPVTWMRDSRVYQEYEY